jgi:hypothetical protein
MAFGHGNIRNGGTGWSTVNICLTATITAQNISQGCSFGPENGQLLT